MRALSDERTGREKSLALVRGARAAIAGVCVLAAAAAWLWDVDVLLGLALVILCEELLETSVVIATLRGAGMPRSLRGGPPRMSPNGARA